MEYVYHPPCGAETPFWIRLRVTSAEGAELVSSRRVNVRNCEEFQGGGDLGSATRPSFDLYPNPANDRITIMLKDNESGLQHVSICDISGRQLRYVSTDSEQTIIEIFVGDMENGLYFVNVCGRSSMETFKLIIQKTDMKNLKLLHLFLLLFLLSCSKDEQAYQLPIYSEGPQDTGWGKATRDGQAWNATAFARRHRDGSGFIGLDFNTYTEFDELREILAFNEIPFKVGKYPVNGNIDNYNDNLVGCKFAVAESDGDVVGALYSNNLSVKGFMNITFVDSINNIVGGSFDVVKFDRLELDPYPEQVSFRNGTFRMKIID